MRKSLSNRITILASLCFIFFGCKKSSTETSQPDAVSSAALQKIQSLGLSSTNVFLDEGDYVIEGDIRIPASELNIDPNLNFYELAQKNSTEPSI